MINKPFRSVRQAARVSQNPHFDSLGLAAAGGSGGVGTIGGSVGTATAGEAAANGATPGGAPFMSPDVPVLKKNEFSPEIALEQVIPRRAKLYRVA
jgi:hypothetical protein